MAENRLRSAAAAGNGNGNGSGNGSGNSDGNHVRFNESSGDFSELDEFRLGETMNMNMNMSDLCIGNKDKTKQEILAGQPVRVVFPVDFWDFC